MDVDSDDSLIIDEDRNTEDTHQVKKINQNTNMDVDEDTDEDLMINENWVEAIDQHGQNNPNQDQNVSVSNEGVDAFHNSYFDKSPIKETKKKKKKKKVFRIDIILSLSGLKGILNKL